MPQIIDIMMSNMVNMLAILDDQRRLSPSIHKFGPEFI